MSGNSMQKAINRLMYEINTEGYTAKPSQGRVAHESCRKAILGQQQNQDQQGIQTGKPQIGEWQAEGSLVVEIRQQGTHQ